MLSQGNSGARQPAPGVQHSFSADRVLLGRSFREFPRAAYVFVPANFSANTFAELAKMYADIDRDPKRVKSVREDCQFLAEHAQDTSARPVDFAIRYRRVVKHAYETSNGPHISKDDQKILAPWSSNLAARMPVFVLNHNGKLFTGAPFAPEDVKQLFGAQKLPDGKLLCIPAKKILSAFSKQKSAYAADGGLSSSTFPSQDTWRGNDLESSRRPQDWAGRPIPVTPQEKAARHGWNAFGAAIPLAVGVAWIWQTSSSFFSHPMTPVVVTIIAAAIEGYYLGKWHLARKNLPQNRPDHDLY